MTTINRLNATISDHAMAAKFAALFVLVCVGALSAAAIIHNANLTKSSYDTLTQSSQAEQTPAVKSSTTAQASEQASTITVTTGSSQSLQSQPKNEVSQLQPAASLTFNATVTANTLQPSTNTVQLTGGADLQNAQSILQ